MKKVVLLVSIIALLLTGCNTTEVVEIDEGNTDNPMIAISDKTKFNYNFVSKDLLTYPDGDKFSSVREYNYVVSWLDDDTLLYLHQVLDFKAEDNTYIKRYIFKKLKYSREAIVEEEQFNIDIELEVPNNNIKTIKDELKYTISLSPDKRKILLSVGEFTSDEIHNGFLVYTKSESYLYNIENKKLVKIPDSSKYYNWSEDGKVLYGYKACVDLSKLTNTAYFAVKNYEHTKYNTETGKVSTIISDLSVKEKSRVPNQIYNMYLNVDSDSLGNSDPPLKRNFQLNHINDIEVQGVIEDVNKIDNENISKFIQSSVIIGENNGDYIFISELLSAVYKDKKFSFLKNNNIPGYYQPLINHLINEKTLIIGGVISGVLDTISSVNMETGDIDHLYYGKFSNIAYSKFKNRIAFYDYDKKQVFSAEYKDGAFKNMKIVYSDDYEIGELKFSEYGDKLFIMRSPYVTSFVLNIFTGRITQLEGSDTLAHNNSNELKRD